MAKWKQSVTIFIPPRMAIRRFFTAQTLTEQLEH